MTQWMNKWINEWKGVCRTAPATPDLLRYAESEVISWKSRKNLLHDGDFRPYKISNRVDLYIFISMLSMLSMPGRRTDT